MFHKPFICVDIDSRYVKLIYGNRSKDKIRILDYGRFIVPENMATDGIDNRTDIIKSSLLCFMHKKGWTDKDVIIGIKGQQIITRHMEVPALNKRQLDYVSKLELMQYLSDSNDKYLTGSMLLNSSNIEGRKTINILCAAVPREKVDYSVDLFTSMGFRVKSVNLFVSTVSKLLQCFSYIFKDDVHNSLIVIYIGYDVSFILLFENGVLIHERQLDRGIGSIYECMKCGSNIYETNCEISTYGSNNNAASLIAYILEMVFKIKELYASKCINKNLDNIYIYGEGSSIKGIIHYIRKFTNADVKLLTPDVMYNLYGIDMDLRRHFNIYLNCISLL